MTRIFRLAQYKHGPNMGQAKEYLFYIFFGDTHKGKTKFIILTHGCPLPPPRKKTICNAVRSSIFFTVDLSFYAIVLGR